MKRGRPPKDGLSVKSENLRIRLTPAQYCWIKTIAKERNCNMTELLWQTFRENVLATLDPDTLGELNVKNVEEIKELEKKHRSRK